MGTTKTLLCVVGATASGKTSLAITLANKFHAEIISSDSRQFYSELNIGTAKPTPDELSQAPHHFVGNKSIHETYSAGDFEKDALRKLEELFLTKDMVILVGGSGMYIDAVCKGFDPLPKATEALRQSIIERYQEEGISYLQEKIKELDPVLYSSVDIQNPQRLMRALEVIETTGKPFSEYHKQEVVPRNFRIITIGIDLPREELYQRINERVDQMVNQGLEAEVKQFINYKNAYALRTVGYSEFFDYFEGKYSLSTTIELIKQHTRNFAKRQLTWFRRNSEIFWVDPKNELAIFAKIKEQL